MQAVDFPMDGLEASGWLRLAPDEPQSWAAFAVTQPDGSQQGVFLGQGRTHLNVDRLVVGPHTITCLGGFVYAFREGVVQVLPSALLGYDQVYKQQQVVIFSNYAELLLFEPTGIIRYHGEIAADDLEVLEVTEHCVSLSGIRSLGDEPATWELQIEQIPEVSSGHDANTA